MYRTLTEHELYFNLYSSKVRGIIVLKKESCPITDFETVNIIDGNLTKISFNFDDEKYIIMALYGTRNDGVDFFKTAFSEEHVQDCDHVSYVGDWNKVLNQKAQNKNCPSEKEGGN